jgi:hypothetical protein
MTESDQVLIPEIAIHEIGELHIKLAAAYREIHRLQELVQRPEAGTEPEREKAE